MEHRRRDVRRSSNPHLNQWKEWKRKLGPADHTDRMGGRGERLQGGHVLLETENTQPVLTFTCKYTGRFSTTILGALVAWRLRKIDY